jgi:hypothetical protein
MIFLILVFFFFVHSTLVIDLWRNHALLAGGVWRTWRRSGAVLAELFTGMPELNAKLQLVILLHQTSRNYGELRWVSIEAEKL